MIVADTGAIVALIDADDRHHAALAELFTEDPGAWLLPWAILPEVDHLVARYLGSHAAEAFHSDVVKGAFAVDWGHDDDLPRAWELRSRYAALELGLVDSVVAAVAERVGASAIATSDLRDFGGMSLSGKPKLFPRDL